MPGFLYSDDEEGAEISNVERQKACWSDQWNGEVLVRIP
jgi:hypothetical protein